MLLTNMFNMFRNTESNYIPAGYISQYAKNIHMHSKEFRTEKNRWDFLSFYPASNK